MANNIDFSYSTFIFKTRFILCSLCTKFCFLFPQVKLLNDLQFSWQVSIQYFKHLHEARERSEWQAELDIFRRLNSSFNISAADQHHPPGSDDQLWDQAGETSGFNQAQNETPNNEVESFSSHSFKKYCFSTLTTCLLVHTPLQTYDKVALLIQLKLPYLPDHEASLPRQTWGLLSLTSLQCTTSTVSQIFSQKIFQTCPNATIMMWRHHHLLEVNTRFMPKKMFGWRNTRVLSQFLNLVASTPTMKGKEAGKEHFHQVFWSEIDRLVGLDPILIFTPTISATVKNLTAPSFLMLEARVLKCSGTPWVSSPAPDSADSTTAPPAPPCLKSVIGL